MGKIQLQLNTHDCMSVRGQIAFSMNNHTKLRMECCGRRETQETRGHWLAQMETKLWNAKKIRPLGRERKEWGKDLLLAQSQLQNCCGIFVHCVKMYDCDRCNNLNSQQLGTREQAELPGREREPGRRSLGALFCEQTGSKLNMLY